MSVIDTLVFDRTASDVSGGTDKGYYNFTDANRVQEAVEYVVDRITEKGYNVTIQTGISFYEDQIFRTSGFTDWLNNLSAVYGVFTLDASIKRPPSSLQNFGYLTANSIEEMLYHVNDSIDRLDKTPVPCGLAECGGDYF